MKYLLVVLILLVLLTGCGSDSSETKIDESMPRRTSSEGVIGQWVYYGESECSYITLYGNSMNILFQEKYADNTVYVAPVEEVDSHDSKTRRFEEIAKYAGRYYIIDKNGDLLIYDGGEHKRTAIPD